MAFLGPDVGQRRTSRRWPLLALSLAATAFAGAPGAAAEGPAPLFPVRLQSDFPAARATFEQARALLLERYYSDALDENTLYHAAIRGMLSHVSPPDNPNLAALWAPDRYQSILDSLRGVQVSIGIASRFDPGDGALTVIEVYPGSPAEGVLQPRDRIMRIDGRVLTGLTLAEVNQLLSDDAGTMVQLTLVRDIEVLERELVRERFALENVRLERLPGGIALIGIRKFSSHVADRVAALLRAEPPDVTPRVIFDLRGNSGGLFVEGLRLAELFLPAPKVLLRALRRPDEVANYVSANETPMSAELIVLVNEDSASASEVFAAALQAHGLARLVGTASHGKATLEETFRLDNDWRMKFIVGALYDPRGRSWYQRGLVPDFYVEQDAQLHARLARLPVQERLGKDPQLNAAWKLLRENRAPVQR